MRVGIPQFLEGWNRTKRQRKVELTPQDYLSWDIYFLYVLLVLMPSDLDYSLHLWPYSSRALELCHLLSWVQACRQQIMELLSLQTRQYFIISFISLFISLSQNIPMICLILHIKPIGYWRIYLLFVLFLWRTLIQCGNMEKIINSYLATCWWEGRKEVSEEKGEEGLYRIVF